MLKIEDQMMDFPNGKHDDILDDITMAVTDLQKKKLEESQKPTQKAFHNKLT
jgi:phage terminase large subunit-like protein